jgi:alpha-L-arabinofuranosidase
VKRSPFELLPLALRAAPLLFALSSSACGDDGPTYLPTVQVDFTAPALATVGPDLIGIHTAVYDGLLTRSATTEMFLKDAGVTSLRYPGGSYADLYHWETHTGTMTPASGFGGNGVYIDWSANFGQFVKLLDRMGARTFITVNYGMDSAGTGPGLPHEAAAWVAYANALPTDTKVIGVDPTGFDWKTAGHWAGLRAAAPITPDDGFNFLRISRPEPVGIKYWEVGNELYGNGYYHGSETSAGWEVDMRAPYDGMNGTKRKGNPALAPSVYGKGVKAFAEAMKAIDPKLQLGGIVHWPFTEYSASVGTTDWDRTVLPEACPSMDVAVNHWYPGADTLGGLLTVPAKEIPRMFSELRAEMAEAAVGCGPRGATMPIAITEWGPNVYYKAIGDAFYPPQPADPNAPRVPMTHTQVGGLFVAESYANFMEQGAVTAHFAQLHDKNYLDAEKGPDVPRYGYHGTLIAHHLAAGGDELVRASSDWSTVLAHAARHQDGSLAVMLTNINGRRETQVTLKINGSKKLGATGKRYAYTPVDKDMDGDVSAGEPISSADGGASLSVTVPAYSVVVVVFPGA